MIIRGLIGVAIGVTYGCVVGLVVFLLVRPDLQQHNSGLIMLDDVAMAWLAVEASALLAGASAVLVGLIVGLARLSKRRAGIAGFVGGLLPLAVAFIALGPPGVPHSGHDWIALFVTIAILPIGVALTGMVVATAVHRL